MIQQIKNGRTTILMDKYQKQHKIHINDIIQAAKNDDTLSIELIEEAGEKIGKSIAFLINIFNPEQVIIGGNLANAGDYLMLPLKSAVNKYSLRLVYNDTLFRTTNLDDNIGFARRGNADPQQGDFTVNAACHDQSDGERTDPPGGRSSRKMSTSCTNGRTTPKSGK